MLLGIFMVIWPLISLIRRVRKLMRWRDWILDELPRIVALLPSVLEALRAFFQSLANGGTVVSAMSDAAKQAQQQQAVHPAPGQGQGQGMPQTPTSVPVPGPKPPHEAA